MLSRLINYIMLSRLKKQHRRARTAYLRERFQILRNHLKSGQPVDPDLMIHDYDILLQQQALEIKAFKELNP